MDTKILFKYINILEKYIEYSNKYYNIKSNKEIYDNGFILLSNIFFLLFKNNINKDMKYYLLDKSYIYYIEFVNNVDLLNISQHNDYSIVQSANIFCLKKIFFNLNNEKAIDNSYTHDNTFYDKLYLIINIITNIYIKIYCYFNSYTERYIFNNYLIDYINNIANNNNSNNNKLENLLFNINNSILNDKIRELIYKYYIDYPVI